MARVLLPRALAERFGGETEIVVEAANVRDVLRALEDLHPGIRAVIDESLTLAIDGEILHDALLEPVGEGSEVAFVPRLSGGR